jgi:dTDP-4-dehydrorhamnose 3,5-epimerase
VPVEPTAIPQLLVIRWDTHDDQRGFFRQTYQVSEVEERLGRPVRFQQGNHSRSHRGVLRGFHAEPWDKLIYVSRGRVQAAFADMRPDSPAFGEIVTMHLGDPGGEYAAEQVRVFVPQGVANAFCVHGEGPADYLYDVTQAWQPGQAHPAIAWDDPDLGVPWVIDDPILSPADRANPRLRELVPTHPRWSAPPTR